jgi:hypothetical protein
MWSFGESRMLGRLSLNIESTGRQRDLEMGFTGEHHETARTSIGQNVSSPQVFELWMEGTWPFLALFLAVFLVQNVFVSVHGTSVHSALSRFLCRDFT